MAAPYVAYIHCMAHKLKLSLVECCTIIRSVVTFLNIIDKLYSVFAGAIKRSSIYCNPEIPLHETSPWDQSRISDSETDIVQPMERRWVCKWRSVNAMKTYYSAITGCLRDISEEGEKWSVKSRDLHDHMTRMTFITCLIVFKDILCVIHVTHKAMQSYNCTLSEVVALTVKLKSSLHITAIGVAMCGDRRNSSARKTMSVYLWIKRWSLLAYLHPKENGQQNPLSSLTVS